MWFQYTVLRRPVPFCDSKSVFTLLSSFPQSGGTSDEFIVTTQEVVLGRKIEGLPSTDGRINRKNPSGIRTP